MRCIPISVNYLEILSYLGDPGDKGWIFAPRAHFEAGCLSFYFALIDDDTDNIPLSLSVYAQYSWTISLIDRKLLWHYNIQFEDKRWRRAEVSLAEGTYRLLFEGQISSSESFIGVTKVIYDVGECRGFADVQGI